jgi:predicted TIM-barrel fold metal-dependent hydrolase
MTDRRPKIVDLLADAFQEEEYFFPKIALNEAGEAGELEPWSSLLARAAQMPNVFAKVSGRPVRRRLVSDREHRKC